MEEIKVGDKLGEHSKVLKIIGGPGKTGMGIVYICSNSLWKVITAVKTYQKRFFSSVDVVNAFKLESLAWISLESFPFIVTAYTVENVYDQPLLHLEYIAPDKFGRNTLTHYLRSPISLKKASCWGIQFCHAMEYSITRGVTPHRDIKPDNIMITNTQDIKLTDFGLARLWNLLNFSELQSSIAKKEISDKKINNLGLYKLANKKNIAGTPPWMAPEQFEGSSDFRSDIYSFGIVLFQMINHGKLPFIANSIEGFKKAHQKHHLPQFDSNLFPIVKKCMEKNPEDRYRSFEDLRLDLEEVYRKETGENPNINLEAKDDEYGLKGFSYLSLGFYDEAIHALNKALELEKDDPKHLLNLGNAYQKKGLTNKAIDVYNRVINLSPDMEGPYVNLASIYVGKAESTNDLSIFYKAKEILDKLVKLNPNNVDGLQYLAVYYTKCEIDQNKAEGILERCIELRPNDPNLYYFLGRIYEQFGKINEAFAMFKKTVQISPTNVLGLMMLGIYYFNKQMYEEAFSIFQKLIRINPVHEIGLIMLGKIYSIKDLDEEALSIFQRLIRINPLHEEGLNMLGLNLVEKQRIKEALPIFQKLVKINPSNSNYQKSLDICHELISINKTLSNKTLSNKTLKKKKKKRGRDKKTKDA